MKRSLPIRLLIAVIVIVDGALLPLLVIAVGLQAGWPVNALLVGAGIALFSGLFVWWGMLIKSGTIGQPVLAHGWRHRVARPLRNVAARKKDQG